MFSFNKYKILIIFFIAILFIGCSSDNANELNKKTTQAIMHSKYKEALELSNKSCNMKDTLGCINLAGMYLDGIGTKKNYKKAISIYNKVCDSDDITGGCYYIGVLYENGEKGVPKNYKKAIKYYTESCNYGDTQSCFNLAWMYFDGRGTQKNLNKSADFFTVACNHGNTDACNYYNKLFKK